MDDYAPFDLDEIDFAPVEYDEERLPLLTLGEAHALLTVLRKVVRPQPRRTDGRRRSPRAFRRQNAACRLQPVMCRWSRCGCGCWRGGGVVGHEAGEGRADRP
ncbi:DUF6417 family protein [Streptomyces phaeoluteigriseus]